MATRNIEGKLLRYFIAGVILESFKELKKDPHGADFAYLLDDTANKMHKFLTECRFETGASWSDMQCRIALMTLTFLDIRTGDQITIHW